MCWDVGRMVFKLYKIIFTKINTFVNIVQTNVFGSKNMKLK